MSRPPHPTEFIDLTDRLERLVADAGLRFGILNVQTLHTTTAIVVNEHEPLLLADFQSLLEALRRADGRYRHDDTSARTVNVTAAERPQRACALPRAAAAALGLPQRDGRPAAARTLAACVPGGAGRPARAARSRCSSSGRPDDEGQDDPAGPYGGDEPFLAPHQILAVSAARPGHAGRVSGR